MECGSLFLDPNHLAAIDAGGTLVTYDETYWQMELSAAKERSFGSSLARVAEVFLYCRRPIRRFLDIGTGAGFLLDALAMQLPNAQDTFFGVELFPPSEHSRHANYTEGTIADTAGRFDAGCCIEVVEHLTPAMVSRLLEDLAHASERNALYIFNTGMPEYVKAEDPAYLDPTVRGHIVSYSLLAMRILAKKHGFVVHKISGKTWAYCLEYVGSNLPDHDTNRDITNDIWSACPENVATLSDPAMGSVMYILGRESARAYRVP
jgi:hypothetical protein